MGIRLGHAVASISAKKDRLIRVRGSNVTVLPLLPRGSFTTSITGADFSISRERDPLRSTGLREVLGPA